MSIRKSVPLFALLLAGCGKGCTAVPTTPGTAAGPPVPAADGGLKGPELVRWHHLAEGSEVYPLSWMLALRSRDTHKPFLDNPERFGLLADPDKGADNPYGLPVGVTVAESRDLQPLFPGFQMVGINCAACHVNELHHNGKAVVRVEGAPNLFDLGGFYGGLAQDTLATVKSPAEAWNFAQRLYRVYFPKEQAVAAAAVGGDTPAPADALGDFDTLDKDLAARVKALHAEQLAQPVAEIHKGAVVADAPDRLKAVARELGRADDGKAPRLSAAAQKTVREGRDRAAGPVRLGDVAALAAKEPAANSPLARLDRGGREAALTAQLTHFWETLGLLRARAEFLLRLAGKESRGDTLSGFGRVDAFGGARNFVFKQDLALNAPISFPHLWNLNQITWLHWDANTTSLLERNVGQALGLGAVFNPDTFDSTVIVGNIEELERLARKIQPPAWPAAEFGAIDEPKRKRGEELFGRRCAKCHKPLDPGGDTGDVRADLAAIGTDPLRAENFARPVNGVAFDVALSEALKKVTRKADGKVSLKNDWRVTRQYAGRPLVAAWATAPYLHNNSVPTVYHLLLPEDQRPAGFWVGHREYDPQKLGYTTPAKDQQPAGSFWFDTALPGNGNKGHSGSAYGTDMSEEDRTAVLEYLKSVK